MVPLKFLETLKLLLQNILVFGFRFGRTWSVDRSQLLTNCSLKPRSWLWFTSFTRTRTTIKILTKIFQMDWSTGLTKLTKPWDNCHSDIWPCNFYPGDNLWLDKSVPNSSPLPQILPSKIYRIKKTKYFWIHNILLIVKVNFSNSILPKITEQTFQ